MYKVGDLVRYKGERYYIDSYEGTNSIHGNEYWIKPADEFSMGCYASEDELELIHENKKDLKGCQCGGWKTTVEHHYDWCPKYDEWNETKGFKK